MIANERPTQHMEDNRYIDAMWKGNRRQPPGLTVLVLIVGLTMVAVIYIILEGPGYSTSKPFAASQSG